jgi:hypothetical protein
MRRRQQRGGGELRAFAQVEEGPPIANPVARHRQTRPANRPRPSACRSPQGEQAQDEGRKRQAEPAIPRRHAKRRQHEGHVTTDGAHGSIGPHCPSTSERRKVDPRCPEGRGQHHRRQVHPPLQGEIPRPPPGRCPRRSGAAPSRARSRRTMPACAAIAGQQDDQADRDEDFGKPRKNSNGSSSAGRAARLPARSLAKR